MVESLDTGRSALANALDIEQILLEAQHRWLRPDEICEIIQNYKKFGITSEPLNKPQGGSLFLFDRNVQRCFRRDGHNWRKKKGRKAVMEAHQKLKVGSTGDLNCYYAHGQENENFQRRCYWMLKGYFSHIALVHYRKVTGKMEDSSCVKEAQVAGPYSQETVEIKPNSDVDSFMCSNSYPNYRHVLSENTDTALLLNGAKALGHENARSECNGQASSGFHFDPELHQPAAETIGAGGSEPNIPQFYPNSFHESDNDVELTHELWSSLDVTLLEGDWESNTPCSESIECGSLSSFSHPDTVGQFVSNNVVKRLDFGGRLQIQEKSKASFEDYSSFSKWPIDRKLYSESACDTTSKSMKYGEHDHVLPPDSVEYLNLEGKSICPSAIKQNLFDCPLTEEGSKKLDSLNWMLEELGDVTDVDESHMLSSSGALWGTVENEIGIEIGVSCIPSKGQVHTSLPDLSVSQDQLFSIIDFSPNWAYVGSETKVLIVGRFMQSPDVLENCKWSCMFGEVEVPAEVIADGVLRCHTPTHEASRVSFYITRSNGLVCSEVLEFEYRTVHTEDVNTAENYNSCANDNLQLRFDKLLSLSSKLTISDTSSLGDISQLSSKINTLLKEDISEWEQMLKLRSGEEFSSEKFNDKLFQKLLKEKLHVWLLQKVAEGGKGPSVLDEGGQGVLHFAAALGYDWAFEPTIVAGVGVNFRDVNGWTALHWAASCGREHTVASLISLGAAPGAVTDPSLTYPSGRTPADLASASGHKGIAGYLAEDALRVQSSSLNLANEDDEQKGPKAVQEISERSITPLSLSNAPDSLSLRESLAAVCNATQAAAQIYQVFRVYSFQKKKLNELALSLLAIKSYKPGQEDELIHAAATFIQNKFRSWKARKEFLITKQRIVKIQAHVRGHQVRKHYRKIIWCLGILEKGILRWRRKGSGLSGFKPQAVTAAPNMHENSSKDDDYDFLKEGRKQVEDRIQKELAKVKSMVQYPEGREQYRRLLNVVTEIQEKKVSALSPIDFDEDLIDVEALLEYDTFMANGHGNLRHL
ncbi:hypothetical protein SLA2020_178670 [Shorea laevis]